MKLYFFTYVCMLFLSCKQEQEKHDDDSIVLQIHEVYKTGGGMSIDSKSVETAHHYVILKEYSEGKDYGDWDNFIQFADEYRDTVQTTLPLKSISIVKPYKIETNLAGGEGWDDFRKHLLLTIDYSHNKMHEKLADIDRLTIWQNGKHFSVELLTEKRMKKLGGYFDSSGKLSEEWWKRYKNQVPANLEADTL